MTAPRVALAAAGAALTLLMSCAPARALMAVAAVSAGARHPQPVAAPARSGVAPVRWQACPASWRMPRHWRCGRYPVPRNYARPQAGSVALAVAMLPAADRADRRGSVFFNPGGPGAGGLALARAWERYVGPSVHRDFDLVTWDPRGVAHSSPTLSCLSPAARARVQRTPTAVLTEPEISARIAATAAIARGCARRPLTRVVTTIDNVRDLNRLRAAVGDRRLSYVGISYGTVIGAVYANMFPNRYRALILHGVVDSVTWFKRSFAFVTDDAIQLQKTLNAALRACDRAPGRCALAPNAPSKYARLLAIVRQSPAGAGRAAAFEGLSAISRGLLGGGSESAGSLSSTLELAYRELVVRHLSSSPQLRAAARTPEPPESFNDRAATANLLDVRDATLCSDAGRIARGWIKAAQRADRLAPVFGAASVLDRSMCASWRTFGRRYTGGWGRGRAPILLLNQRWDDATPLAWAKTMTRRLHRARLITINGWGHGIATPCSTRAVDHYILTGSLPATRVCNDGASLFR